MSDKTFDALLEDRRQIYIRMEKLEQLCRDMWQCHEVDKCCNCFFFNGDAEPCILNIADRMQALGLLEGEQ